MVEAARLKVENTASEQPDILMESDTQAESQLPTPPTDTPDSQSEPNGQKDSLSLWNNATWTALSSKTQSSPASTPPPLEDPPDFDDALRDPVIQSNLEALPLSTGLTIELEQFFPDPPSGGSPSSVRAEFDQEDLDFDTDTSDDIPRRTQMRLFTGVHDSPQLTQTDEALSDVDL